MNRLAEIPAPALAVAVLALALAVGWAWHAATRSLAISSAAGGVYLLGTLADWAWLAALPRRGLSFGPVEPSLVGLIGCRLILSLLLLAGVVCPFPPGRPPAWGCVAALALLHTAASGLIVYATSVEPFRLGVTYVVLETPKLPPGKPGCGRQVRLVQISDLHVERITRRERELVKRVRALDADYVLLTGDYLNFSYVGEARAVADARQVLGALWARKGILAVRGTHQVDPNALLPILFDGLPIRWLRNEHLVVAVEKDGGQVVQEEATKVATTNVGHACSVTAEATKVATTNVGHACSVTAEATKVATTEDGCCIAFAGVSCAHKPEIDVLALDRALAGVPDDAFTVLLYHTPDLAWEAASCGVDLYLAGHTHGGQIRVPLYGALVTATRMGKRYEMGRYQVGALTLYVSRGVGMEGMAAPRARFLCPPEIVCIDVRGVAAGRP